jgi:D-sedoheptulose 7-phosphate isomerase
MAHSESILKELKEAADLLNRFLTDKENISAIEKAAASMVTSLRKGGKIISCGNGGSSCDAMHFAEELTGRYRENRKAIAAISISDPGHLTCTANDYGYSFVFSRFIEALGNKGDVLLGISTSGNSENVIKAVEAAKEKGMTVVILSGKTGGKLSSLADIIIRVPHEGYADRIQEVHIKIIHILIMLIEKNLGI